MTVRPLRRITAGGGAGLYEALCAEALSCAWSRNEAAAAEARPELVLRRDGNVLAGLPGARLAYAFPSDGAFVEHFPRMLEALLPRLRRAYPDAPRATFRLTHNPSRPAVEPILRGLWFTPRRAWLLFSLEKGAPLARATVAGVRFREGSVTDAAAVARIDDECFPESPVGVPSLRAEIAAPDARLLIAHAGGTAVGFALARGGDDGAAYLGTLAVSAAYRRRGIGAALTARVARAAFAGGASRLELRTEDGNAAAIRLYLGMGFRQTQAGRDYTRPLDPREIARLRKAGEGTLIRFGGWR